MKRREFLHLSLSAVLAGVIGIDKLKSILKPYKLDEISKYCVMGYHHCLVSFKGVKKNTFPRGCGVIVGDYFITLCHIANSKTFVVRSPFGEQEYVADKIEASKHYLDVKRYHEVNKIYISTLDDMAVFKLTKPDDRIWKFGINTDDVKYGDLVYLIGNPGLGGTNIREAYVSDVDGVKLEELGMNFHDNFGVSVPVIPGDSGSPVVNKNFELIGLSHSVFFNGILGYVKKIKPFMDIIRKENLKKFINK